MSTLRLADILALIFVALLFTGCSDGGKTPTAEAPGPDAAPGNIKIGFLVKQPEEQWFQLEWKFARQCADKYGFELITIGIPDGQETLKAIDSLAVNGAKGFVICTPDVRLGPAIVNKAKQLNLKFMSVDDQFVDADGHYMTDVHHLGISASKIGQTVGKALYDEMTKRKWDVNETGVCIITWDQLDTSKDRTEGEYNALVECGFPKDRIFRVPEKSTDVTGAFDAGNILLTQHPEIKRWLVTGMNDSAAMGAVRAMEGRGFTPETLIGIGINGTECIGEFEKEKPSGFYASILLEAKQHGFLTTETLYKWITEGKEPPKDTRTTGILINRENFKQVLKEQGIRD
jgi:L-arabinose transport system substrate-binding protein